jgi:hypothetical protein
MLAEELNLTREQREYSDPSRYTAQGNRKWRNEIQFVRNQLADKGEIDRSQYDTWTISVQGYGRLGVEPRPDAPSAKKTASEAERHKKPAKSQLDKALELLRKLKPKE